MISLFPYVFNISDTEAISHCFFILGIEYSKDAANKGGRRLLESVTVGVGGCDCDGDGSISRRTIGLVDCRSGSN